ncbi:hypothetical protein GIB67_001349 [Kingdonia uniflora]|uniref:Wall-associated receptor kinase galacturonan-binding domain-containing protein n=1 Tax=Kingdonia uniflora TaxID=39325 RepID=A0A7J7MUB6_9MAGN|nr:hypothetical protein GIB67_001349 [Kingdonia uniflora]
MLYPLETSQVFIRSSVVTEFSQPEPKKFLQMKQNRLFHFFSSLFFVFLVDVPVSLCDYDFNHSSCFQPFECGSLLTITYPFWGNNRADYCGLSGFELKCEDDIPEIDILSVRYRVLAIDQVTKYIKIGRKDISDDICLPELVNTTLDSSPFKLGPGYENLAIFYNCSGNQANFTCERDGNSNNGLNFATGSVPGDQNVRYSECETSITVPVLLGSVSYAVKKSILQGIIEGFEVTYDVATTQSRGAQSRGDKGKNVFHL